MLAAIRSPRAENFFVTRSRQTISVLISIGSRGLPDEAIQAAAKSRRILPLSD